MIKDIKDPSPLRDLFLNLYDQTIYDIILNYFSVVDNLYWRNAPKNSYIFKTVGIQALFDVLKGILKNEIISNNSKIYFNEYLDKTSIIDFSDKFFQSSGIGRSRIRNTINLMIGKLNKEKIKKIDLPYYEQIINQENTNTQKEKWIWEEEAENAVIYTLQNAIWNFDNNSVSLFLNEDLENVLNYNSFEKFILKLEEIADTAFVTYLPSDNEFAEEQKEKFDTEDLVYSCLTEYETNLKKIGWQK